MFINVKVGSFICWKYWLHQIGYNRTLNHLFTVMRWLDQQIFIKWRHYGTLVMPLHRPIDYNCRAYNSFIADWIIMSRVCFQNIVTQQRLISCLQNVSITKRLPGWWSQSVQESSCSIPLFTCYKQTFHTTTANADLDDLKAELIHHDAKPSKALSQKRRKILQGVCVHLIIY